MVIVLKILIRDNCNGIKMVVENDNIEIEHNEIINIIHVAVVKQVVEVKSKKNISCGGCMKLLNK